MTPEVEAAIWLFANEYFNGNIKTAVEHVFFVQINRIIPKARWYPGWEDAVFERMKDPFSWEPKEFKVATDMGMKMPSESRLWKMVCSTSETDTHKQASAIIYLEKHHG